MTAREMVIMILQLEKPSVFNWDVPLLSHEIIWKKCKIKEGNAMKWRLC